jgi:hypothetical protein
MRVPPAGYREIGGGDPMGAVLVWAGVSLILLGSALAVVQLRRGDVGLRPLRGQSAETRRAVRRAIRDGHTDDAEVDRLARQALRGTPRLRGARYFFAVMMALSIVLLAIGPYRATIVALRGSETLLWAVFIALNVVNQRRYDNYRGLAEPDRRP